MNLMWGLLGLSPFHRGRNRGTQELTREFASDPRGVGTIWEVEPGGGKGRVLHGRGGAGYREQARLGVVL